MSKPNRRMRLARSERNYHNGDHHILLWNHGSYQALDKLLNRRERHAAKAALSQGFLSD